jgi:predicted nuclease of restriction endonuclease-like (RecB) superfamily
MARKRLPSHAAVPVHRPAAFAALFRRIQDILEQARRQVVRTVNSEMVRAYWLIGREIVEEEQHGQARAGYGEALLAQLASELQAQFGKGYTRSNLQYMRQFYLAFPALLDAELGHAPRSLPAPPESEGEIRHAPRGESYLPGRLNPNLSWTHYRSLLKVESADARSFYEVEAVKNHWSSRELDRQINTLLFERLAKSRDKKGLLRLAAKGQQIQTPEDAIKDPFVLEFVGLPESPRLVETDLEEALITNLQMFLLELGRGFAFVARQQRITLEGDHFYVDLVFYHVILKCYVLIDLKVEKLTHADLGQMQLYVNYYDETQLTKGDNPTIGLLLCADKNDLMVKYTLGKENRQIFASRYKLHLPTEKELAEEIRRELRQIQDEREPGG